MLHERRFNYDSLPEDDYMDEAGTYNNTGYEAAYPVYRCPYCQSALTQGAMMNLIDGEGMNSRNPSGQTNEEQRILQQFLNEDGQVDVQKMLQTIGQFADTVQQVSPVIKQINDVIKSFRT